MSKEKIIILGTEYPNLSTAYQILKANYDIPYTYNSFWRKYHSGEIKSEADLTSIKKRRRKEIVILGKKYSSIVKAYTDLNSKYNLPYDIATFYRLCNEVALEDIKEEDLINPNVINFNSREVVILGNKYENIKSAYYHLSTKYNLPYTYQTFLNRYRSDKLSSLEELLEYH
ncbi:hypothetical protein JEM51_08145 [Ligilactobacillus agilis]|uniref:hypothetical protein n=1 Tax=Ligilactobacillus agilis TaxID=1601 RepID=UPI00191EEDDE|nr:hypothetical protein [Ligilactobacillus agilis]MBL1056398.1 hypothetical protein [Ligilactobacillus agilis]